MHLRSSRLALTLLLACGAACTGEVGSSIHIQNEQVGGTPGDLPGKVGGPGAPEALGTVVVPATGLRRLSKAELKATLGALFGDSVAMNFDAIAEDPASPFDNDYELQQSSISFMSALEGLVGEVSRAAVASDAARGRILPCSPSGIDDTSCLRAFVASFGRKALRRPLTADEQNEIVALVQKVNQPGEFVEADFYSGVAVAVQVLLLDPEFVFRVERGTPSVAGPGIYTLDDFTLATRLSYLLWGEPPDDSLLDRAAAGELRDAKKRRAIAAEMLESPRARAQIDRIHAMWLGYEKLPHDAALTNAMRQETRALLDRVIFTEKQDYLELFRATETFIDATLAAHYDLPERPTQAKWVSYGDAPRQGILSHGTVLSAYNPQHDTSPVRRGLYIQRRLLCDEIPPPPKNVNDSVPDSTEAGDCKPQRFAAHATGGCAACHERMDPLGFGLENFDRTGRYRTEEPGKPHCTIEGNGRLVVSEGRGLKEIGSFSGPAQLSDVLISSGRLEACVVRQIARYALGRTERAEDEPLIATLAARFAAGGRRFDQLLLDFVADDVFAQRREDLL